MNVLFVYSIRSAITPRRPIRTLAQIHIGLSCVAGYVKSRGHSVRLVVLNSETETRSRRLLDRTIREFNPRVVAFTAVSTQYPFIQTAAARVKAQWPGIPLVVGGIHATIRPGEVARDAFDYVCVGEGELPMGELLARLETGQAADGIANLWIKRPDGTVQPNAPRPFLQDLDALPAPERSMWHPWILQPRLTHHALLPSRGCPYTCSYCSNHVLRKVAPGKYVRFRSPASIIQELRYLKQAYPEVRDIYLQSETIAVDKEWLAELAQNMEAFNATLDSKIWFTTNFRVARPVLTEEVFRSLQRAGVRTVEIGLESGSERVRCDVLRRRYSNDDFFRAIDLARTHGMEVNVYNMIGLPGETPDDFEQTIAVNHRADPARMITSIFHPYPGTDLYATCLQRGLITPEGNITAERVKATLDLPEFPRARVQAAFDWFDYRVYRGRRSLLYRLRKVVRNKIESRRWLNLVFLRLLPLWYAVSASKRAALKLLGRA